MLGAWSSDSSVIIPIGSSTPHARICSAAKDRQNCFGPGDRLQDFLRGRQGSLGIGSERGSIGIAFRNRSLRRSSEEVQRSRAGPADRFARLRPFRRAGATLHPNLSTQRQFLHGIPNDFGSRLAAAPRPPSESPLKLTLDAFAAKHVGKPALIPNAFCAPRATRVTSMQLRFHRGRWPADVAGRVQGEAHGVVAAQVHPGVRHLRDVQEREHRPREGLLHAPLRRELPQLRRLQDGGVHQVRLPCGHSRGPPRCEAEGLRRPSALGAAACRRMVQGWHWRADRPGERTHVAPLHGKQARPGACAPRPSCSACACQRSRAPAPWTEAAQKPRAGSFEHPPEARHSGLGFRPDSVFQAPASAPELISAVPRSAWDIQLQC